MVAKQFEIIPYAENASFKMKTLLILSILSSYLVYTCTAEEENTAAVSNLIKKVCDIARAKLHMHSATPEQKQMRLQSLQDKLQRKAESLGPESTANIKLIIQGLTILSINDNYEKLCGVSQNNIQNDQNGENSRKDGSLRSLLVNNPHNTTISPKFNTPMNISISENVSDVVQPLLDKMELIMKTKLEEVSSIAEKQDAANTLKKQLTGALRRAFHDSNNLDQYIKVAERGMDVAADNLVNKKPIPVQQSQLDDWLDNGTVKQEEFKNNFTNRLNQNPLSSSSLHLSTTTTVYPGVTVMYTCQNVLKETCSSLKQLDKFTCEYDGTTLDMQQMCDGDVDCPDGSDERNCIQQIVGKIHTSTQVMARVEMSRNCFHSLVDDNLLSKQGELLSSLLNSQVDFLKKYADSGLHLPPLDTKDARKKYYTFQSINAIAYEVAVIVRSFAMTLNSALCENYESERKAIDALFGDDIDKEVPAMRRNGRTQNDWTPSICQCEKQYCANMTNCEPLCKRFCYQYDSLQNFNCQSIKKSENIIPLDSVCDGKLDCYDETDETSCPTDISNQSKIDGNHLFDNTISMLETKTKTNRYLSVRVEMVELQICIQTLQRYATSPLKENMNYVLLKNARDKCFKKLAEIFYDTILQEKELVSVEHEDIYNFLTVIKESLTSALISTNIGNKNTIFSDECYCNGEQCIQLNCPPQCMKICTVKSLMTKYNCSSSPGNITVPIYNICNGKSDCPNAEDEYNCKPDICRVHHLKVFRHDVKSLYEQYLGTSIAEDLEKWKTKVDADLIVLGQRERLTPTAIRKTVEKMVNDLILTYGSITVNRRHDKVHQKKFVILSQQIMEFMKECTR